MTNQEVDTAAQDELVLWFENTQELYNRREIWIKNFNLKIKRGVFNRDLAIKGIVYLAIETIRSYRKEFGLGQVNAATKLAIAKDIFEQDIEASLTYPIKEQN